MAAFRYWLYRLRRERLGKHGAAPIAELDDVRLVPVEVRPRPSGVARVDLRVAGVRVLVPVGTDPRYLAQVAVALRDTAAC